LLFSRRFSRTCLEGISFKFFVCFIFNVSLGSAPKRKNFDIQCNTRVASGGQFTLNYHTPSHMHLITENMSTTKCLEIQDGVERKRRKIQEVFFMLSYKAHFEEVKRF